MASTTKKISMFQHHNATPSFLAGELVAAALFYVVVSAALRFRDIEDAMAFYGVYHREPLNQLIHFFGVPGILWSIMIIFAHLPFPFLDSYQLAIPGIRKHAVSWATVCCLFYTAFYIYIDPFGGVLYSPFIYAWYSTSTNWTAMDQEACRKKTSSKTVPWTGSGKIIKVAAFIHAMSWYVQIHPGHAVFEGAKPAVLDSVGGALTSAPLFAFYEGMWFLGINKGLQARTQELVAEYTIKLCAEGSTMRACAGL